MKIASLFLVLLFCTACSTTSTDWKHGKGNKFIGPVPYQVDINDLEVEFNLYTHQTRRFEEAHTLQVEHDEIKYKLQYKF